MSRKETSNQGLEGVVAGDTSISFVDEKNSMLYYRGISIDDLARYSTFEETLFLLLRGELPERAELNNFRFEICAMQSLPEEVNQVLSDLPVQTDPMDALKIAVGILEATDPEPLSNTFSDNLNKSIRIIAKLPVIIAAQYRISKGRKPIAPRNDLTVAGNFLYMLKGEEPKEFETAALDKTLILYAEHEFNASTFAARITASTLSDIHSAIITAIGTLKGPLHGGANEKAMEMLLEIGKPEEVEGWMRNAFIKNTRIMGFGHRVYKKNDPRNRYVKKLSEELGKERGEDRWFKISERVEAVMLKEKRLHPNLDFYSSSVYFLLGIPVSLYTPIFAASRSAGWAAHIMEQHAHNRLIRPRGNYTGHKPRSYKPMEER